VTDDNGNVLDNLGFEPFGSRKTKDWTANISSTELGALLDLDWDHTRKARGFTGHEHLDRTGFIHMNGRVYDPVLGRFLSPDPIVQLPAFSQSWNRYSYVSNSPLSLVDPSGFIVNWPGNTDGGWFQPTFLEFLYLFGVYDPRQDDLILYANGCYAGCAAPIDPFANEISQTETTVYSGTIFVGPGASITGSLFGKHGGFEGSIAAAVTIGPGEWDIGLIRITGTPTDDLPIAANVGADIVFGVINRSIRNMEGKGITINLMIPVPGTLLSASGSEFETLEGRRIGGQFGIGTPGFGVSITETNTSTYSVRNAIISLRRRLTDSFCQLDANCQ
jgi:RHS repeat-associated protein